VSLTLAPGCAIIAGLPWMMIDAGAVGIFSGGPRVVVLRKLPER
jgi:hypothetical protein